MINVDVDFLNHFQSGNDDFNYVKSVQIIRIQYNYNIAISKIGLVEGVDVTFDSRISDL